MITAQELKEYVDANPKLVKMRESERYPGLFVVKYTKKVFFDALWDSVLEECRGLVVDKNYNAVVRPFTKIYNRHERGTDIDRDQRVVAIRKVNGFMAAVTHIPGVGNVVSTTGSLDSEFADLARRVLADTDSGGFIQPGWTYLFEIVDPSDPHIIPEEAGAYLIGMRLVDAADEYMSDEYRETYMDTIAATMGVKRPEWKVYDRFSDLTASMNECKHEGYVVYGQNKSLKIKSPYYLVSKLLARMGHDRLTRLIDNDVSLRQMIDEEFYPLIEYLQSRRDEFVNMEEQDRLSFIRKYFEGINV